MPAAAPVNCRSCLLVLQVAQYNLVVKGRGIDVAWSVYGLKVYLQHLMLFHDNSLHKGVRVSVKAGCLQFFCEGSWAADGMQNTKLVNSD